MSKMGKALLGTPKLDIVDAMVAGGNHKRFWAGVATIFGVWLALSVALTGQASLVLYTASRAHPDLPHGGAPPPTSLSELLLIHVAEGVIWASLTLGILWLGKRFPLTQGRWARSLSVHLGASVLTACIQTLLAIFVNELIRRDLTRPTLTANVLALYIVAKTNQNVFLYWAIFAVGQIINYHRDARERDVRASQLEAKLAQTQLQVLKMQLQPHFLFNTLNAIAALIHQDVELADRMIARLGDLLRSTLENANQQEVSLQQELDFIQPYLEIEKARLGARLSVHLDIDPAARDAKVPNLILQPLVENAIRHGIAPRPDPGRIDIAACRDNGSLHLSVMDDGPGLRSGEAPRSGIGLANTRARLQRLYGDRQQLQLGPGPGGGLRVEITIPYDRS
jgi:two-component system, LytTR family, sensor kinase